MTDEKNYDDIIDVPYPFRTDRPRMSMYDRASQFAPFAALAGYDSLIEETARLTESCPESSVFFKEPAGIVAKMDETNLLDMSVE